MDLNAHNLNNYIKEHISTVDCKTANGSLPVDLHSDQFEKVGKMLDPNTGSPSRITLHHPDANTLLIDCFPFIYSDIFRCRECGQLFFFYEIDRQPEYHKVEQSMRYEQDPAARYFAIPRHLKQRFVSGTRLHELNYPDMIEEYSFHIHNDEVIGSSSYHLFNYEERVLNGVPHFTFDIIGSPQKMREIAETLETCMQL